ncbi:hypothetical protein [Ralstonia phage RP31]|uniref:Uncharacterized protein n=1 Tax=Ralstonia phage RP31 TaxID=1923890 RepID=A0A1L7N1C4_9CAUD|nr:hypothetical protein [Ralstonia phage RP31]
MNIKIDPAFPEVANIGLTSIAVVLNDLFKKYEQTSSLEDAIAVSHGLFALPFLKYQEKRIHLKGSSSKKVTYCSARLVAYSKKPDDERECLRFLHAHRCVEKEEVLKQIPALVREAHFDADGEITFHQLLDTLSGIKADKINYHYSSCTCEGSTSYRIGVVHEFGPEGNPYCTVTCYFVIDNGEK